MIRRFAGLAAGVAAIVLATGTLAAEPKKSPTANFPITFGGPFTLVDQDGATRSVREFVGKFVLVYFGYTYCPDICPTGLTAIGSALDMLGEAAERVQPVFVSVDPARDTPARLKEYVPHFHERLIGLTGSEAQVRAAAKAYRVHRRKVEMADDEDYLVDHSSITYLMGPDGRFVTLFPHGRDARFMADAMAKYLR